MPGFSQLKIRSKLMATFSLILIFMAGVGWVGYQGMRIIDKNLNELFLVSIPSVDLLIEADRDLHQALIAERTMIFETAHTPAFASLQEDYEKNIQQADDRFEKFTQLVSSEEERRLIQSYKQDRSAWKPISRQVVELAASGTPSDRAKAQELSLGKVSELFEKSRNNIDQLTEITLKNAELAREDAGSIYRRALITLLGILVVACGVSIVMAVVLSQVIAKPIREAVAGLMDIAQGEGDLTKRLQVRSKDEIGELGTWLNVFMEKLQGIIRGVRQNTQALDGSSSIC